MKTLPSTRRYLLLMFAAAVLAAGCQTPPTAPRAPTAAEQRNQALRQLGFVKDTQSDLWELSLGVKLLFDTDVDTLTGDGQVELQQVARTLRTIGIDRVRIEGHTDNVGQPRYNDALSLRRADSVAQALVRAGMQQGAIERLGLGATKPVADNTTPAGRAQNRRVVITVLAD